MNRTTSHEKPEGKEWKPDCNLVNALIMGNDSLAELRCKWETEKDPRKRTELRKEIESAERYVAFTISRLKVQKLGENPEIIKMAGMVVDAETV